MRRAQQPSKQLNSEAIRGAALATQEKKKGSIEESDDSDDDGERSPVPSTQSEQMVNGNPTVVNKSLWPAINY